MPRFAVYALDVWGNAADGYETNDRRLIGSMISNNTDEGYIKGLIHAGLADENVLERFRNGEVQVDTSVYTGDDGATITANDPTEVVLDEDGEILRYFDDGALEEGEAIGEVIGEKPQLVLEAEEAPKGAERFFAQRLLPSEDMLELRIIPGKESSMPGQFDVYLYLDDGDFTGSFFGRYHFPNDFKNGTELAVTSDGELLVGDTDDSGWALIVSKISKALDAFFERGGTAWPVMVEGQVEVERIGEALRANSEALLADKITHSTFQKRNRELWDEALQLRLNTRVTDWLRDNADGWYGNEREPGYNPALFVSEPDLPRLVRQDGFNDGANHWDVEVDEEDLDAIERDPMLWAEAYVLDSVGNDYFGTIEQMHDDREGDHPELTEEAWRVLLHIYRRAVISGVAEDAQETARRMREDR